MAGTNDIFKSYYPPRARWYSPVFYFFHWLRRRLHLDDLRLPSAPSVRRVALSLLLPGFAFLAFGQRTIGRAIYGSYALATVVFIIWLGYPISSFALGLMISLHVSSVLYLAGRQLRGLDFPRRVLLSMTIFSLVYLCIYNPLRRQFEIHVAMPLRTGNGVLMIRTQQSTTSVKRGDFVAYRTESRSLDHYYLPGGFGFGRVQALAGERVVFTDRNVMVNSTVFPRQPFMPTNESWVVPEKHWFIWPESAIRMSDNPQQNNAVAQLIRESAMVEESQFVGKPFRRWFWRRQTLP